MENQMWHCDRCSKPCFYEDPENLGVYLSYDIQDAQIGKLSDNQAYEKVCDACANDFYQIAEKCSQDCQNCPATQVWGLSVMECLDFQERNKLLSVKNVYDEVFQNAGDATSIFEQVLKQFLVNMAIEKLKGQVWSNHANYDELEKIAKKLSNYQ